ncbi:hypothetical protein E8E12_000198 [Didymella heteroderae]|uniref:Uncharacterized protein n=1 Tax=Didymella heteroderae TaxID=1769908 RepID=A0A9P4WFG8_9PLEO|nr:hypothetical protein E8E12_000198 [Didymella heteroderae]
MALSVEAIVAIVTLFVACPPAFIIIWKLYRRHGSSNKRTDTAYELGVLPSASRQSPHGHLAYYMFTERRVEARVVSSYGQLCTTSDFATDEDA